MHVPTVRVPDPAADGGVGPTAPDSGPGRRPTVREARGIREQPLELAIPILIGLATLVATVSVLPRLARAVLWNADAAAPAVIAESIHRTGQLGPRTVLGDIPSLWDLGLFQATAWLPHHRALWLILPYLTYVAGAILLARSVIRATGRPAAGAASLGMLLCGGTAVQFSQVAPAFRGSTWLLLGVLAFTLTHRSPRPRTWKAAVTGLLVSLLIVLLASDPMGLIIGVIPFMIASAYLVRRGIVSRGSLRRRLIVVVGSLVGASGLLLALARAGVTTSGSRSGTRLLAVASPGDVIRHAGQIWRNLLAVIGVGNGGPTPTSWAGWIPVLVLAGIAPYACATFLRRTGRPRERALALFMGCGVILLLGAYLLSDAPSTAVAGAENARYLVPLWLALSVIVPLAWAGATSPGRATVLAAAMTVLMVPGFSQVLTRQIIRERERGPLAARIDDVTAYLRAQGVTDGIGGYWDANALRYADGVDIAAVDRCPSSAAFCRVHVNTRAQWYCLRGSRSFAILNRRQPAGWNATDAVRAAGRHPSQAAAFGEMTVLVFDVPGSALLDPGARSACT